MKATAGQQRFADDEIIRVPVYLCEVEPSSLIDGSVRPPQSWLQRMRRGKGARKGDSVEVRMTRRDFRRYCVRNEAGTYVGSEPWSVARAVLWGLVEDKSAGRGLQEPKYFRTAWNTPGRVSGGAMAPSMC